MSFGQEIKDFLSAYQAGEKIETARTDREYKKSLTEAQKQKTTRDNDPETLKLAADTARAKLADTLEGTKNKQVSRGYTSALTDRVRNADKETTTGGAIPTDPMTGVGAAISGNPSSGVGPAGPMTQPFQLPNPDGGTPAFAEGGAVEGAVGGDMVRRGRTLLEKDRDDSTKHAARVQAGREPASNLYRDTVDFLRQPVKEFAEGGAVERDSSSEERRSRVNRDGKGDVGLKDQSRYGGSDLPTNRGGNEREYWGTRSNKGALPVKAYADGGLVDDEEPDDTPMEPAPQQAIPTSGATDFSSSGRMSAGSAGQPPGGSMTQVSPQLVHDATKAGLAFGASAAGIHQKGGILTPKQKAAAMQFQRGYGAIPAEELDQVKKAVDPDGKLTEAQRNMAALGSVFQYQMNKGNAEGAQRAAFQVLQAYRLDAMRYASIAAHAAENGDLDTAARAAVKAYANVPSGNDLAVFKDEDGRLNYSYTDGETGKTHVKGIITPKELAAQAMGMATGGFDKAIIAAAGQRETEAKGKGALGGAPKYNDRKSMLEAVGGAADEFDAAAKEASGKGLGKGELDALKNASFHIHSNNPNTTPQEAVSAAAEIIGKVNKEKPDDAPFKIQRDEDTGANTIVLSNKRKITLSDDELDPLIALRGKRIQEINAERKAADEKSKKGGKTTGEALGSLGEGALDVAKDAGRAVSATGDALAGAARRSGALDLLDTGTQSIRAAGRRGLEAISNPNQTPDQELPPLSGN